ncbi:MAG: glucose-6-phosphate isomerase [Ponticaulis sp.]|nr:glucose-6-phosphate isomerase [Ponticaulis sp.]|tara:strand:+ start:120246 stop:121790 length:1545 start_codon:yes stop_codon:yes gene_type:complete
MENELKSHHTRLKQIPLESLIAGRQNEVLSACSWTVNLARQHLDDEADQALLDFAEHRNLGAAIENMFIGEHVNESEDRPALHWALRTTENEDTPASMRVRESLDSVFRFADQVRSGDILPGIKAILHLGIGGSDLGPRLLYDAFSYDHRDGIRVRFASNVDPMDLNRQLIGLNPETTLVVAVSKSFTSEETRYNLDRTVHWLKARLGDRWQKHVAIVTAAQDKAKEWLEEPSDQIFELPSSVGGRYSLWSAASLSCIVAFGSAWFRNFLKGAREMDEHFRTTPLKDNIPVRLALIDYWNMTVRGIESEMVLAYSNALRVLPAYLQQLLLESNGKSMSSNGEPATDRTIVAHWGGEGTIGQHSYHQWLHQGTSDFASEFVVAVRQDADGSGSNSLIAHALAQAEVLANGYSREEILADEPDLSPEIVNQKVIRGGHPSVIIANREFKPKSVGSLLAMYEHRTFVAGRLWQVNSFDQWGVERGKKQASRIKQALSDNLECADPITQSLVSYFKDS